MTGKTAAEPRTVTTCDQCGASDDHPKHHFPDSTKHHDCLSYAEEQQIREANPTAGKIIDACKGGKRGSALLTHIESLHKGGK